MKIIVPAYFYPGPIWDTLLASDLSVISDVIINPNSGPGGAVDLEYAKLCVRLRKKGVGILGYVSTQWARRSWADVMADVAEYRHLYGIQNIFLDEAATSQFHLNFYRELYEKIQGKVVLNHGTIPDERYFAVGDVLVIFESDRAKHAAETFPSWLKNHQAKTCQIVTGCGAREMKKVLAKVSRDSAYGYITDDVESNPYDALPSYWKVLVKECAKTKP